MVKPSDPTTENRRSGTPARRRLNLVGLDGLAIAGVVLAYILYFILDTQTSEFLYAVDAGIQDAVDFDQIGSFSVDDYVAPWRYRLLPRLSQWLLYQAISPLVEIPFIWVPMALSCLSLAAAFAEFYVLLRTVGLPIRWSLFGWLLAATSFPALFGYRGLNYMTLDDTLSFALVLGGLLALISKRYIWYVVFSVLAVLTRESTLVLAVLPMFDRELTGRDRLLVAVPSVLVVAAVRRLLWQPGPFTTGSGLPQVLLRYNLFIVNPALISAYLFAVFGIGWLLGSVGWWHLRGLRRSLDRPLWLLWASAPAAAGLVIAVSLLFGVINEIRIMFLAFPWVIGLGTAYLHSRFRSLLTYGHLKVIGLLGLLLALPPGIFLLVVPGGQGLRLATLSRLPGFVYLYQDLWTPFRVRFTWVPGQLEHILFNAGLFMIAIVWLLVDKRLQGPSQVVARDGQ